jgi:hypothetical protein
MRLWISIPAAAAVLVVFHLPRFTWGDVLASLLVCAALAMATSRSTASGPVLITALAGLHFVIYALINIPEGVLFDVIKLPAAPVMLLRSLLASFCAVAVLAAVAGRLGKQEGPAALAPAVQTVRGLLWRLAALPAVFLVCYMAAGMLIFPFVKEYYAMRTMPDPAAIASMQILRSLAILGAAYPLLRTLPSRRDAVIVLAVALPVFGAIAPLLPANDLMPGSVRFVHTLEMAPYYALFGVLIAVWFGAPGRGTASKRSVAAW